MAEHYPEGNLNCGLAHGIPGPLAVMALGLEAGLPVEGLKDAVIRTARWLARHRTSDRHGVNWPTVVPYTANGMVEPDRWIRAGLHGVTERRGSPGRFG